MQKLYSVFLLVFGFFWIDGSITARYDTRNTEKYLE